MLQQCGRNSQQQMAESNNFFPKDSLQELKICARNKGPCEMNNVNFPTQGWGWY